MWQVAFGCGGLTTCVLLHAAFEILIEESSWNLLQTSFVREIQDKLVQDATSKQCEHIRLLKIPSQSRRCLIIAPRCLYSLVYKHQSFPDVQLLPGGRAVWTPCSLTTSPWRGEKSFA